MAEIGNPLKLVEPARELPIVGNYDMVVAGGGIAGVAAALAVHHTNADVHALSIDQLQVQLKMQNGLLDPALVARVEASVA